MSKSRTSTFAQVLDARLHRRSLLKGLAASAAVAASTPALAGLQRRGRCSLSFPELPPALDQTHHLAEGYDAQVFLRWGDPVLPGASSFAPDALTAEAQARQFGYNNDYLAFLPIDDRSDRGILSINHEYTDAFLMFPGMTRAEAPQKITRAQMLVEQAAHGHTIVEVEREAGSWRVVPASRYNRRITGRTPMRISGPAAGHDRMKTKADPTGEWVLGTLANCSGGQTPWGTVLIAEENVDLYFKGDHPSEHRAHSRMRINEEPKLGWYRFDERFRVDEHPTEANRFGWIVEIDPHRPDAAPVKRTALGRCKHECAAVAVNHDGRIVIFSGDDERFEYLYRYVSKRAYDPERSYSEQQHLLDEGTLYAAKFTDHGQIEWLPLVHGVGPLNEKNGFASQADVMIETRRAADLVGATKMDRPEDVEIDAKSGRVFVSMTNNHLRSESEVDPANPRPKNNHGHIVEIRAAFQGSGRDFAADRQRWDLFLLGGDPREHGGRCNPGTSEDGWLSCPDNLALDPKGRVWICTDGQDRCGMADALYAADVSGPGRALTRRFFVAPRGAEVTGACFTPDASTLFLSVQHPGQESESSFDQPTTRWPDFSPKLPPRPSVLAISKKGGGPIG